MSTQIFHGLSLDFQKNSNVDMKFIERYPDICWHWNNVFSSANLTANNAIKCSGKPWDWENFSSNENLSPIDVIENSELPWKHDDLSLNEFEDYKCRYLENVERNLHLLKSTGKELVVVTQCPRKVCNMINKYGWNVGIEEIM